MPTKPFKSLLYRDLSRVEAKDIIDVASPLLQELVNNATNVFARCASSASDNENEDLAVLMLYLHIIEMIDGIEVLISQSCAVPAIPLLRSSFEALLSMEYILESDYVRRSLSWLTDYAHKRLTTYDSLDPSTDRGKAYQKAVEADEICRNISLPDIKDVQGWKENLKSLLARPQFQPIEAEYEMCKKKRRRQPAWYSLFGGPRTLHDLSMYLNKGGQYEILYRHWSTISHAHDISRFLTKTDNGEQAIRSLRDPHQIQGVINFTAPFLLNATRLLLGKFRPGENWSKWYLREVHERYRLITG